AIGMLVAHSIPFRAIRAGKQLSDSKGSSAAITTEAAITAVKRSMMGFLGPRDIFRNPEAIFRAFEGPGQLFSRLDRDGNLIGKPNSAASDASPFDLVLSRAGDDFAVMGMHFKIGLYEHQSAGASQAIIDLVNKNPTLLDAPAGGNGGDSISKIKIVAYEPAYGIIGDPAKMNPTTRQSADHSMAYIIATLLRKAIKIHASGTTPTWHNLMLSPMDYAPDAITNAETRAIMHKIEFVHGGDEYDARYPDGIPTSVVITDADGSTHDSGMVMYPAGHARNTTADLQALLDAKFHMLGGYVAEDPTPIIDRYRSLESKSAEVLQAINNIELPAAAKSFDG
ncbi:MAG: hypothetical protein AAF747_06600, partial [Planctomycetota bacterium]